MTVVWLKESGLKMDEVRKIIAYRIKSLDGLIKAKIKAVDKVPDRKVKIDRYRGRPRFYVVRSDGGKDRLSGETAHLLIQRSYDNKVIKSAIKERDFLNRMLNIYPSGNVEDVIKTINCDRRSLITPVWKEDDVYIKEWLNASYDKKAVSQGVTLFRTRKGDLVRSKSELIIADRLYELGIPYRYEAALILGDTVIHPDFTVLDVRHRREIYFEHFGMMNDPKYASNAARRLNLFNRHNIILGDRLFFTMETDNVPLDTEIVDRTIGLLKTICLE